LTSGAGERERGDDRSRDGEARFRPVASPYAHRGRIRQRIEGTACVTTATRESAGSTSRGSPDKRQRSVASQDVDVDDQRLGSTIRAIRIRRRWRQSDLAKAADVSPSLVSRLERGRIGNVPIDTLRRVLAALDVRLDLVPRWRGGELDRLLNARHSALHEDVSTWLARHYPEWIVAPEVSFSIQGERGIVDMLLWHPARRALVVVELKTDIVDVNELLGTHDRKRRLARRIARERDWPAEMVASALIVAESRTNRRRLEAHEAMIRNSLPDDGRRFRAWLRDPSGGCDARLFWIPTDAAGAVRARVRVRPAAQVRPEATARGADPSGNLKRSRGTIAAG
jgi:transcriptional regulator with XRE-family HTH domain